MKKPILSLLALTIALSSAHAQTTIKGALQSYNDGNNEKPRTQQYFPISGGAVCENGTNRFTRALYGSHSDWRLETSDRPAFAVVKKGHHRNISMTVTIGGREYPLDSTTYCKAKYDNGMRDYQLRDDRWPKDAWIIISTVARPDKEGAVWMFMPKGFSENIRYRATVRPIAARRLSRNGDIGADKPGVLEPNMGAEPLQVIEWTREDGPFLFVDLDTLRIPDRKEGDKVYDMSMSHAISLSKRIEFSTPDPYINALAPALTLAADGDWDGSTWLHGCIGWRMPLAGWRAAYVGDVLGWNDRAVKHFDAYAKSQVTSVEPTIAHPSQDPKMQMARAEKKWGTQMYSNGYICRNPERNDQMHHYDMNLNYIDELLWHFQYDADTAYMRKMWPVIKSHLAWEKRNYDPDGDHLYDAYCCIWASDALYYSGGAVTHSSAYNYRGNRLAARIAEIIGEDAKPYNEEADAILKAMNERLWINDCKNPHWAEYQEAMGLRRKHESAAVWSIYTPIDCGACSPEQAFAATQYVSNEIPRFPVTGDYYTISTSNWLPYAWSINNVAPAEVMHTVLAFFEAGRSDEAYKMMMGSILDNMYYGQSPLNFGQLSHFDAARGECYRDFGDVIGISSRTLLQGLFGIIPQALYGKCILQPGFPAEWDSASVKTPYMEYKFTRRNGIDRYEITQNFSQPLKIILRQNLGGGKWKEIEGNSEKHQVIESPQKPHPQPLPEREGSDYPRSDRSVSSRSACCDAIATPRSLGTEEPDLTMPFTPIAIDSHFNSEVDDIFKNQYLSPRPQVTTLQIPIQGVGEWCHPQYTPEINDSVFRTLIASDGTFTMAGVPFKTPREGKNIAFTSLWDNYPESISIPLSGKASTAYLLMAGSTNHMQCHIDNGCVIAEYKDDTADTLMLRNPDNWCPIEQDYYIDGKAFRTAEPRPYRVSLGTGNVSRDLGKVMNIKGVYGREIKGGAAQLLRMPLNPQKKLKSIRVRTLSNDVVIGLMAVTLQK